MPAASQKLSASCRAFQRMLTLISKRMLAAPFQALQGRFWLHGCTVHNTIFVCLEATAIHHASTCQLSNSPAYMPTLDHLSTRKLTHSSSHHCCFHCRFATAAGKLSMQRVLRAYAVYDTEVGYCQGMNFLAGLLLTYMPNEACAFGGLVVLMQERKLRELYKTDLAQLQVSFCSLDSLSPYSAA